MTGREKRLKNEWEEMEKNFPASGGEGEGGSREISYTVERFNEAGLPIVYRVVFRIKSFCGVENSEHLGEPDAVNPPIYAERFEMTVTLPENYPCADASPRYYFTAESADGKTVAMPWHPNIRFFGAFAGRVCLNAQDNFEPLAWNIKRMAAYLKYERYHAEDFPPYPEDLTVARWVREQAEPKGWIKNLTT